MCSTVCIYVYKTQQQQQQTTTTSYVYIYIFTKCTNTNTNIADGDSIWWVWEGIKSQDHDTEYNTKVPIKQWAYNFYVYITILRVYVYNVHIEL